LFVTHRRNNGHYIEKLKQRNLYIVFFVAKVLWM